VNRAEFPLVDVPETWPVRDSTDLHRDDWVIALRADQVTGPNGDAEPYGRLVLEHPGAAIVLAVDDDANVICLRQYRHASARRFVELPAGLLDADDESPLAAAQRELREEVQLAASRWTLLTSLYPSPGIMNEVQHLFLAQGLSPVGRGDFVLEHEEADMETAWVPFADLLEAVLAGRIADAPLVVAVLLAHTRGLVGATP
jgi:8-oxo-dGDP phosphatase